MNPEEAGGLLIFLPCSYSRALAYFQQLRALSFAPEDLFANFWAQTVHQRCVSGRCEYGPDFLGLDRDTSSRRQENLQRSTRGQPIKAWRHVLEGEFMANDAKDESVLGHIDGLVKEERLYSQGELPNLQTSHYVRRETIEGLTTVPG